MYGWEGPSTCESVAQNEQRGDLVGEERSDDLGGQPRGKRLLSELLDEVTGNKKQQLFGDQQYGERRCQHTHPQQLARYGKLLVIESEAEIVRAIFRRYAALADETGVISTSAGSTETHARSRRFPHSGTDSSKTLRWRRQS